MRCFLHKFDFPSQSVNYCLFIPYILWKLLFQRLIWHIWGPSTCILWSVRFFVSFWESTGSISWNLVIFVIFYTTAIRGQEILDLKVQKKITQPAVVTNIRYASLQTTSLRTTISIWQPSTTKLLLYNFLSSSRSSNVNHESQKRKKKEKKGYRKAPSTPKPMKPPLCSMTRFYYSQSQGNSGITFWQIALYEWKKLRAKDDIEFTATLTFLISKTVDS